MATIYYNSSGAGDYLESDEVTRTWGAGSDANDGLTRAAPKLTADYLDTAAAGDINIFNQGDYDYTSSTGRLIFPGSFTIDGAQDHEATITLVGTGNTQGLRTNSTNSPLTLTLGKVKFKSSGTITNLLHFFSAGTDYWTYDLSCEFILTSNLDHLCNTSNTKFNLNTTEGFKISHEGAVSLTNGFKLTGIEELNVDIQSFDIDGLTGRIGENLLYFQCNANIPNSSFFSVYPHGIANITNSASDVFFMVENPPDKSKIKVDKSLDLTLSSPSTSFTFATFWSPSANLSQSDNCLMYREFGNSARVTTNAQEGIGFAMGRDSDTDTNGIDGDIINIRFEADAETTGSIHAICHFGSTGRRVLNDVSKVGIGSIGKNGLSHSVRNSIRKVNTTSGEYLFAKGCDAGTTFVGDICYISKEFSGIVTKVSDSGLQNALNPLFDSIMLAYAGGSFPTGAFINRDGDSGDTSEGTRTNMFIDPRLSLDDATFFRRGVTNYTLATSQTLGSNPFVNPIVQDVNLIPAVAAQSNSIIGSPIIG